jgi:DNA-binding CsgD family transcriptional regulator
LGPNQPSIAAPGALTAPPVADSVRADLVRSGAELVELSERFYRGVFIGAIIFVTLASLAALALLPTRSSVPSNGPPVTVALTLFLIAAAPLAVWRAARLYRLFRRKPAAELGLLVVAIALIVYPLRSELWWPACGLLMLLAALAPLRRALAYCFVVLLANLAAHAIAGDLTTAPPVSMIGLWIGLVFWTTTFGLITERLATSILLVNVGDDHDPPRAIRVVASTVGVSSTQSSDVSDQPTDADDVVDVGAGGLSARQLQVVALMADGLRYRDIAACLSISERQVQRHVSNAIAGLGVGTSTELVALAVTEGLVPARADSPSPRDDVDRRHL